MPSGQDSHLIGAEVVGLQSLGEAPAAVHHGAPAKDQDGKTWSPGPPASGLAGHVSWGDTNGKP